VNAGPAQHNIETICPNTAAFVKLSTAPSFADILAAWPATGFAAAGLGYSARQLALIQCLIIAV